MWAALIQGAVPLCLVLVPLRHRSKSTITADGNMNLVTWDREGGVLPAPRILRDSRVFPVAEKFVPAVSRAVVDGAFVRLLL